MNKRLDSGAKETTTAIHVVTNCAKRLNIMDTVTKDDKRCKMNNKITHQQIVRNKHKTMDLAAEGGERQVPMDVDGECEGQRRSAKVTRQGRSG